MLSTYSKEYYEGLCLKLNRLLIYRDFLKDPVISSLKKLIEELSKEEKDLIRVDNLYYEFSAKLIEEGEKLALSGDLFKSYIINLVISSKNFFTLACEKHGLNIKESLYKVAKNDIDIIKSLLELDFTAISNLISGHNFLKEFDSTSNQYKINEFQSALDTIINSSSLDSLVKNIINYYYLVGSGELANYIAFCWSNDTGLVGIKNYDSIELEDIVGYEYQKEVLIKNIDAFVNGYPANNVLLVGARGTGKSSSIKALINKYFKDGLRLIEITKDQILNMHEILLELKQRGKYFIVFIDDLSFEDAEIEYKKMKSILDGGVEQSPDNVLICATSNRRHLIKETWADRNGEEIHNSDSVNEKMSLSDRFGITLTYLLPDQEKYIKMVEHIAEKHGIEMPKEELKREAIRWELAQNGRSGRTAKQFVNYLLSTPR